MKDDLARFPTPREAFEVPKKPQSSQSFSPVYGNLGSIPPPPSQSQRQRTASRPSQSGQGQTKAPQAHQQQHLQQQYHLQHQQMQLQQQIQSQQHQHQHQHQQHSQSQPQFDRRVHSGPPPGGYQQPPQLRQPSSQQSMPRQSQPRPPASKPLPPASQPSQYEYMMAAGSQPGVSHRHNMGYSSAPQLPQQQQQPQPQQMQNYPHAAPMMIPQNARVNYQPQPQQQQQPQSQSLPHTHTLPQAMGEQAYLASNGSLPSIPSANSYAAAMVIPSPVDTPATVPSPRPMPTSSSSWSQQQVSGPAPSAYPTSPSRVPVHSHSQPQGVLKPMGNALKVMPAPPAIPVPPPAPAPAAPAPPAVSLEELQTLFESADRDRNGFLTERELAAALVNGDDTKFHPETVRVIVRLFDTSGGQGRLQFAEFSRLWKFLREWRVIFDEFDTTATESVSRVEFALALKTFGYNLTPEKVDFLFNRYTLAKEDGGPRKMPFDMFVQCFASIKSITDTFKRYDTDRDGVISIEFQDFLMEATLLR